MEPEPIVKVVYQGGGVIEQRFRVAAMAVALLAVALAVMVIGLGSGAPKAPHAAVAPPPIVSAPGAVKSDRDGARRDADDH